MTIVLSTSENTATPRTGRIGLIVVSSMALGLMSALTLTLIVLPGASEHVTTGLILLAFGIGWGLLAWLSIHRTDQPQRWARVPAASMGIAGLGLLIGGANDTVMSDLGWIWPLALATLAYWINRAAGRDLRSRTRAWVIRPICVALAITAIGGGTEVVLEATDHRLQSPAARTFDVNGHRMYLECTGIGSPTVVLTNGFGERSPSWAWITPEVARTTRVCVYDRAGQGWSEPAERPQDGRQLAADLHSLLAAARITGPLVLAGHSVGGIYDLIFAERYPDEVAGLVLLDSATPDQFTALPNYPRFYSTFRRVSGLLPVLGRLGVGRLSSITQYGGLPAAARDQERAFAATAHDLNGQRNEWAMLPDSFAQAKALTSFNGKPLIVLTAGRDQDEGWPAAQGKLAALSSNSAHRTITNATHEDLLGDQGFAIYSSTAINDVVAAARMPTLVAAP